MYNNFKDFNLLSLKFEILSKNHLPILFIFEKVQKNLDYIKVIIYSYDKSTMQKQEQIIYNGINFQEMINNIGVYINEKEN